MATLRDLRRLSFLVVFQLDARGEKDAADVLASIQDEQGFTADDVKNAFEMGQSAFAARAAADSELEALAPGWPAHRQAAVDRAILRLAHYEMCSGRTPPAAAINEAIELAKEFSTDRSPAFVNGLLDKVLKRLADEVTASESGGTAEPGDVPGDVPIV